MFYEDACMIGDRLDNNIAPAKSHGLKTIWINQGFGRLQQPIDDLDTPDHIIGKLSDLMDIL